MEQEHVVLTLSDGKKYAVVKALAYQDKEYLYLVDVEDALHQVLCELNDTKIRPITDLDQVNEIILNAKEKSF